MASENLVTQPLDGRTHGMPVGFEEVRLQSIRARGFIWFELENSLSYFHILKRSIKKQNIIRVETSRGASDMFPEGSGVASVKKIDKVV